MTFGDNDKAIFGAGSDLQIYHDGSNNWVDGVSGAVFVRGSRVDLRGANNEMLLVGNQNGNIALYYDNSTKLATTSTGIDVTGTATMDGLTVDGTTGVSVNGIYASVDLMETDVTDDNTRLISSGGDFRIDTLNDAKNVSTKRLTIDHGTGDISFYEDTGTTPKFFWDASAERLGVGTSSPSAVIHAVNSPSSGESIAIFEAAAEKNGYVYINGDANRRKSLVFQSAGVNKFSMGVGDSDELSENTFFIGSGITGGSGADLVIDSSGNVGIGTSSPSAKLHIEASTPILRLKATADTEDCLIHFADTSSNFAGVIAYSHNVNDMKFFTNQLERLRIDSSGNVGIGVTSAVEKLHVKSNDGLIAVQSENVNTVDAIQGGYVIYSGDGSGPGAGNRAGMASYIQDIYGTEYDLRFYTSDGTTNFNEAMRIDPDGNVGIGTDSPIYTAASRTTTTINGASSANLSFGIGGTGYANLFVDASSVEFGSQTSANPVKFTIGGTEKMRIDSSGKVGIGTSTVQADLHLGAASPHIDIGPSAGNRGKVGFDSNNVYIGSTSSTGEIHFKNNIGSTDAPQDSGDTKMVIADSGVGIGTTSPQDILHLYASSPTLRIENTSTSGVGAIEFWDAQAGTSQAASIRYDDVSNIFSIQGNSNGTVFSTPSNTFPSGSEAMRIDSSGNLLVGKTSTAIGTAGTTLWSDGLTDHTRSGEVVRINRLSTDGDIVTFRKDGTTVGSIGVNTNVLYIGGTEGTDAFIGFGNDIVRPVTSTGAYRDNAIDLGYTGMRFKDLYLSGGLRADTLTFSTLAGTERMRIDSSGTLIHKGAAIFNEDGGDSDFRVESDTNTHALFVDAANSRVGINQSSPSVDLHISFSNNTTTNLAAGSGLFVNNIDVTTGTLAPILFSTDSGKRIRSAIAHVDTGAYGKGDLVFYTMSDGEISSATLDTGDEKMRIDSSGNLLVGTTDNNVSSNSGASNSGINIGTAGIKGVISAAAAQVVTYLNRLGTDGDIALFRKDGTTVGSIGVAGGSTYIDGGASNYSLMLASDFRPRTANGAANNDGNVDLGDASARFKDLYLSGSARASIFYDTDNTAYYVDPASTSNLNAIDVNTILTGTSQTRGKISVWSNNTYGIGMGTTYTYGGLNDYAMTFQMSDTAARGYWWGDSAHTNAQGAMSLTTEGLLAVAGGMRLGYGQSDTTAPTSGQLDVNGTVNATTFSGALSGNATTATTATNQSGGTVSATTGTFSTSATIDGHLLQDSSDRSGLLEISTALGTWKGIQIKPTSTSFWSIMGDQDDFGLYDDANNEWILLYNENSTLQLHANGSNTVTVTTSGLSVTGSITVSGTVDGRDVAADGTKLDGIAAGAQTGTVTSVTGGTYLTGGTITTTGTLAVDATSANTASKVVARDASGNFSAGTITAALSGNATTATTLQTARTINGVSFDGSANITVADSTKLPLAGGTMSGDLVISKADAKVRLYDSTGTNGNNPFIEFDTTSNQGIAVELNIYDVDLPVAGYGLVVGPSTTNTQFPTTGTLTFNVLGEMYAGGTTLSSLNKVFHDGYHPNADKLTTARTINGVSFDGTANITVADATKLPLTGGTLSGNLALGNNNITGVNELVFNDNVKFLEEGNNQYLRYQWGGSGAGGIILYDGDGTRHGTFYGSGAGETGILDNDGSWAVRIRTGTSANILYCNNNAEFYIYTTYTYSPGSSRAPIFYDSNNTSYYVNPHSTTTSANFAGKVICTNVDEAFYLNTGTTLDPNNGAIQFKSITANTTFTDNVDAGESMTLRLTGGATYTVTWPTITWITSGGNVAPTLNGTSDVFVFWKESATLYGAYVGYGA
jgi:hypothetical protein